MFRCTEADEDPQIEMSLDQFLIINLLRATFCSKYNTNLAPLSRVDGVTAVPAVRPVQITIPLNL